MVGVHPPHLQNLTPPGFCGSSALASPGGILGSFRNSRGSHSSHLVNGSGLQVAPQLGIAHPEWRDPRSACPWHMFIECALCASTAGAVGTRQ